MHILIANNLPIPALKYGGTERVIWWLGKELHRRGHRITYLVSEGSTCPFADIIPYDRNTSFISQIPKGVDVVHSNFPIREEMSRPYIVTIHGYDPKGATYDRNTVFVSRRHAQLHHSNAFVYNGLDPEEYGTFDPTVKKERLLFLAAVNRLEKNLKGAIKITKKARKHLEVIGGKKGNFSHRIHYHGLLGGHEKNAILQTSSALLFPVTWDEPFGLALIEAMYHGCPVIGTPYGSLPEVVSKDTGILSASMNELVAAAKDHSRYDRMRCHDHVMQYFTSVQMADAYLDLYKRVLDGEELNSADPYFTRESFIENYPII